MAAKKSNLAEQLAGGKLVTFQEILDWLEISQRTLRYWIAYGNFPKPARRKRRAHLWLKADVQKWVIEEFNRPADTKTAEPPGCVKRCSILETKQAASVYNRIVKQQGRAGFPNGLISNDGMLTLNPSVPSARIAFKAPDWQPLKDGKLIPLPASGVAAFFVLADK